MPHLVWAELALPNADAPPRTRHAVLVEGGRIADAGPYDALRARFPDAPATGGDGYALVPALINSHDHGRGLGTAPLGVPDDLLEIWLPGLWSQPAISPYLAAAYDGLRLLRAGVCATAHSHNPRNWLAQRDEAEDTLRGYADAGIRAAFHPVIIDQNGLVYDDLPGFLAALPPELRAAAKQFATPPPLGREAYLALCDDLVERHHDASEHTAHIQISPAGGQWCSDELIAACVAFAQRHGTRVQMHMLETRYQALYARRRWGTTFVRHLEAIGALGPWLTLAHMVHVAPDDLALLAERGVAVAHNPSSNLRLRSGVAPVEALARAGVTLGVGLDGHSLDEDQDYLRELRLAWTLANRPGAASGTMAASEVWRMGTSGGAAATFGAGTMLGTLDVGAPADLVLLDWSAVRGAWFAPQADPFEVLLRRASGAHVAHVMVGGRWALHDGRSTTLDEAQIVAALREELRAQPPADANPLARSAALLAPYLRRFYASWEQAQ